MVLEDLPDKNIQPQNTDVSDILDNRLGEKVKNQQGNVRSVIKLPSLSHPKDCAKEIMDYIYRLDNFRNIEELYVNTGLGIKINTDSLGKLIPSTNALRFVFGLPESKMYNSLDDARVKSRVFGQEYNLRIEGQEIKARLTTEWVGKELDENSNGNYLEALVIVVNKFYSKSLEIKSEADGYYLYVRKSEFKMDALPEVFKTGFSRRYITSLLAKPFVILTGNSGTGKTRISKQFAEYLEQQTKDGHKNWLIVPVGADWTDNTKILGFYNPLADNGIGKYEKTKVVELIEQANENKTIPFFLILDEMNLSHVERYFSDFLSHMEVEESKFVLDGYDGILEFPDNLFVVGTVNIDETTYMFSPKVLDRANVVEFKPEKKDVLAVFTNPTAAITVNPAGDGSSEAFLELSREVRAGKCELDELNSENLNVLAEVQNIFGNIYEVVEKSGFEFAYRTVREIRQYISASYEISGKSKDFDVYAAIDEQLLQKVLPKIHGNKKEIGQLLDELGDICAHTEKPLVSSAHKIEQMKRKLATVQYASFI